MRRCVIIFLFVFGTFIGLVAANGAYAFPTIDSVIVNPREFNDVPGATLTVVNNYPSLISFNEQGVSSATGFANRDVWRFSNNGEQALTHSRIMTTSRFS